MSGLADLQAADIKEAIVGMQDTIQALYAHISGVHQDVELLHLVLQGVGRATDNNTRRLKKIKTKVVTRQTLFYLSRLLLAACGPP